MICAKCNAGIADNARFCNKCGEKVDKSLGAGDTVTCPECRTTYPRTTKFCKKDGTRLGSGRMEPTALPEESKEPLPEEVEVSAAIAGNEIKEGIKPDLPVEPLAETAEASQFEPYQQPSAEDSMPKKPKGKMPLVLVLLGILVIGSGVGSYFYFSKKSNAPAVNQTSASSVDKAKASTETAEIKEKDKPHPETANIPSQPEPPQIKPAKLAKLINRDLKSRRLGSIAASVNHNMVVTLKGSANSPEEKASAINIAGMYKEAAEVKDNIHVKEKSKQLEPRISIPSPAPVKPATKPQERPRINDPYLLASEINRALKNAGLRFVTASVTDNFEIYLMGMVTNSSDREKALRIARSFREGRKIIDQMMNNY